jgi:hypothetical protein
MKSAHQKKLQQLARIFVKNLILILLSFFEKIVQY